MEKLTEADPGFELETSSPSYHLAAWSRRSTMMVLCTPIAIPINNYV